jgi:CheY-like chemotaxis protein
MLDHDDLKWLTASLTELNRRLQQVSRFSEQAQQQQKESEPLQLLDVEVELAAKTSQALFDRITSRLLTGGRRGDVLTGAPPNFTVVKPAADAFPPAPTDGEELGAGEIKIVPKAEGSPIVRNPSGRRELILVVDDEPEVLERASLMLQDEDYRILLANDGLEALQIYRSMPGKIALVILDFFLPVMDGEAIFDELKAIDPNVQVVLSSGFREQTKLGGMLARGLCGFIPKPYSAEKLLDQVRSIIAA